MLYILERSSVGCGKVGGRKLCVLVNAGGMRAIVWGLLGILGKVSSVKQHRGGCQFSVKY